MKKSKKPGFYPILLNLERLNCLIVGGGKVACRKALSLLKFNTAVTMISPRFCRPILDLAGSEKIVIIKKAYSSEYLKGFGIVFSATDNPEINRRVRTDCTEKGILLNAADKLPLCDFILPANISRGDLIISISSQGKAPFFTKEMKKKINKLIPPVYEDIFDLAGKFRQHILADKKVDSKTRAGVLKFFASKDWVSILQSNGSVSSKQYINRILKELDLV